MRVARFALILFALSFIFILGSAAPSIHADGLSVTPSSGLPGTTFTVYGGGFRANEPVTLFAQLPSGSKVPLARATADGSGNVSFQVATDPGYPPGTYSLVAHGENSGIEVWGQLSLTGGVPAGPSVSGTAYCSGSNFVVPGFASGESVMITAQLPNGSSMPLGTVTADGGGTISIALPLSPGLPRGSYTIYARGLASGRQTSDQLSFDGSTLSGTNCSISIGGGGSGGITPSVIMNAIVNYQGAGVYLNTNPNALYYFDCNWKWRPMGDGVYMAILGFRPNETVDVSYEILGGRPLSHYSTISSDGNGNAVFAVNTYGWDRGHYHWWFSSPSARYCGHYDLQ